MVKTMGVTQRLLFDDETFAALESDWQQQLARMTLLERVREFLARCDRRTFLYRSERHQYPCIGEIARYCECSDRTIMRIANGQTKTPSRRTLSIIDSLANITPAASGCDVATEFLARIEDANRWAAHDPATRGDILAAINAIDSPTTSVRAGCLAG